MGLGYSPIAVEFIELENTDMRSAGVTAQVLGNRGREYQDALFAKGGKRVFADYLVIRDTRISGAEGLVLFPRFCFKRF